MSEDVTVTDDATISYRGAGYEIGRGRNFYGIWAAGALRSQPLAWWPQTPDGWAAAWSRFVELETPGTIVAVSQAAAQDEDQPRQDQPAQDQEQPAQDQPAQDQDQDQDQPGLAQDQPGLAQNQPADRSPALTGRTLAICAAGLIAAGVGFGIAGLFPGYVGGTSLTQTASQWVPHAIYLAIWAVSAGLILGGVASRAPRARRRVGALLGIGLGAVTFGLFFSDLGEVFAGSSYGAGLVLTLIGWLACTAGCAIALWPRPAGSPVRPRGFLKSSALPLTLATAAAIGTAVTFVPSWDSFTLRTSSGLSEYVALGNAFANPAPVIAGNVMVIVAIIAVAAVAALWHPIQHGAALLAGAIAAMITQAISALIALGEPALPAQFGISPGQAAQAGLTISSGLTASFWIYCVFLAALAGSCALMIVLSRQAPAVAAPPAPAGG